ncbi:putative MFS family arabinose efflux permease [Sphingopyxis sp. OAS728]|uniref:spinster family MFS transporter n=1 Tax=Sphingopyxis sp. OAS728 TaxID=2663823 RepID=UPI00178A3FEF|nr:MFS transporter [Sphingopyxis sp. OAS728]MBE1529941.1 putative MFS family arabinose efflux permease [Sphingopyxis sp. OAS728]
MSAVGMGAPADAGMQAKTGGSKLRAGYILFILCLISALNYYDRFLIGILVEDLKRDLTLSDSQIGLLSGFAFALVYSIASIPVASYADRGFRVRVLGSAAAFWSVMTGLCGLATGFWTMLFARFGVGIGESGGAPTTHAIVAETFSDKWRASALAAIGVAGAVGTSAAFGGGGYIAQHYGWRWAFFAAAIPGVVIALIFALTVREPKRAQGVDRAPSLPARTALGVLLRRPAYLWICAGVSIFSIGGFGASAWTPAYLMRYFGQDAAKVGLDYSAIVGPATIIAVLGGGFLADWLSRKDARAPYWFLSAAFFASIPFSVAQLTTENYATAMMLAWPSTLIGALWISPTYAIVQALSGSKLRAIGAAFFMLCVNLVGQSLGPLVVGAMSDHFSAAHGALGLRYALLIGTAAYVAGGAAFLIAARTARADTEAAATF